jgi:cysteinyl-tRNA synthetase
MIADAAGLSAPWASSPDLAEPRATEYVPQMLRLIGRLQDKGLAYQSSKRGCELPGAQVPRATASCPASRWTNCVPGERVAVPDGKDDPLDFVLWKACQGIRAARRPMAQQLRRRPAGLAYRMLGHVCATLGETFDIHGGGADLQFPHHENEIAQSEGANGKPLARFWVHNGFVRVDNEKMSKSLGNFFTIREVLEKYDAETMRFFLVRAHYRSALELQRCAPGRRPQCATPPVYRAGRRGRRLPWTLNGRSPMRPASRLRWTKTSARRRP